MAVLLFDLQEIIATGFEDGFGIGCRVVQSVGGDDGTFERTFPVESAGDGLFAFAFAGIVADIDSGEAKRDRGTALMLAKGDTEQPVAHPFAVQCEGAG